MSAAPPRRIPSGRRLVGVHARRRFRRGGVLPRCFACPGPGVSEIRPRPAAGWTPPATVADITRPSAATAGEYDHVAAAACLIKHARSAALVVLGVRHGMGRLESVLDLLTASEDTPRLVSFGEFERRYVDVLENGEEKKRHALAIASNPLMTFSPEKRPVYWRMLIAQACLYQAILRVPQVSSWPSTESEWMNELRLEHAEEFEWKSPTSAPTLDETLGATQDYLRQYVVASRISRDDGSNIWAPGKK
jgi:hypothetical protein